MRLTIVTLLVALTYATAASAAAVCYGDSCYPNKPAPAPAPKPAPPAPKPAPPPPQPAPPAPKPAPPAPKPAPHHPYLKPAPKPAPPAPKPAPPPHHGGHDGGHGGGHGGGSGGSNKCNVGELQCCKSVQQANSQAAQNALGALNIPIGSVQGLVGLTCNPISVIGVGAGANCNATPVCCSKNKFSGAVALGCSPINLNL